MSWQNALVIRCQVIDKLSGNLRPQFLNAPSSYCAFRSENTSLRINNVSRCQGIKVSGSVRSVTVLPSTKLNNLFRGQIWIQCLSLEPGDSKSVEKSAKTVKMPLSIQRVEMVF